MKNFTPIVLLLMALLCFTACTAKLPDEPTVQTTPPVTTEPVLGWQEIHGNTVYVLDDGSRAVGWMELDGARYYFDVNGILQTHWLELDGNRYYLGDDGIMHTGWLELDGNTYYMGKDGSAATGEVTIDGIVYHFTAQGHQILLVNPWNTVPQDYNPDLVKLDSKISSKEIFVDRSCFDALNAMIAECNRVCPTVCVVSGYRTNNYQKGLYDRKVNYYLDLGYSKEDAKIAAAKVVAVPGTSEHQLGLAVDIIDTRSWSLTEVQETLPAQKWLMENCWKYGFVLRYPKGTTSVTGIIYEPWHYRYVGPELAKELHESNITLEAYLQNLTKTQP